MATQTVRIPIEIELQGLQNEIVQMKKMLNSLTPNTKAFNQLSKAIDQIDHKLVTLENRSKQTFSSQSEITNFAKSFDKIGLAIQDVYAEFKKVDFKDLKLSPDDDGVKQIKNLENQIENIQKKIKSVDTQVFDEAISKETIDILKGLDDTFDVATASLEQGTEVIGVKLKEIGKQIKEVNSELNSLEKNVSTAEKVLNQEQATQNKLIKARQQMGTDQIKVKNARVDEEGNLKSMRELASKYLSAKEIAKVDDNVLQGLSDSKRSQAITAFYANLAATIQTEETKIIKAIGESASKLDDALLRLQQAEDNYLEASIRKEKLESTQTHLTAAQDDLNAGQRKAAALTNAYEQEIIQLTQQMRELIDVLRNSNNVTKAAGKGMESASKTIEAVGDKCKQGAEGLGQMTAAAERLTNIQNAIRQWFGFNEVINLTKRAIRDAISHIRELDAVMTEIAVVTDMTQAELWDQIGTYSAMAQQYGVATKGVYEVSQLYYQQGDDKDFSGKLP